MSAPREQEPEIAVNGKPVGHGMAGMQAALQALLSLEDDSQPPCPRCKSTSVNCPLSGPGCPYDGEALEASSEPRP